MKKDLLVVIFVIAVIAVVPSYMLGGVGAANGSNGSSAAHVDKVTPNSTSTNVGASSSVSSVGDMVDAKNNTEKIVIYDTATDKRTELTLAEYNSTSTNVGASSSVSSVGDMVDAKNNTEKIVIYDTATDKRTELTLAEYALGATASEMPAKYHEQALIAQGAAAISHAKYSRLKGLSEMEGVDVVVNSAEHSGFMTREGILDYYGKDGEQMLKKLEKCANIASTMELTYNGEPVAAAYHAISSGMTESAENVWGTPLPYLVTVPSSSDVMAEKYKSTVMVSLKDIRAIAEKLDAKLLADVGTWLEVLEESEAGYVTKLRIGNKEISGVQARELFGLRSACFSITRQGDAMAFYVRGYGHGCGMSQNGANFLAQQGKTASEILLYYYKGININ